MARPLRIEYAGAVYHVTARGNARKKVFLDDTDRAEFLATLGWVVERFGWICYAYCLMDNHYHLLIETPQPNLSRGMRQLNGVFTQRFNRRHRRVGHLFQGRFKAILVERDSYLLALARYIVLNPVHAKRVAAAEKYPWSSYPPTLGLVPAPAWLSVDALLDSFAATRHVARKRYAAFVAEGVTQPSPWSTLVGQALLGGEAFIRQMAPRLQERVSVREITKRQRLLHRPTLTQVLAGAKTKQARDRAMERAYREYGYTQAEIARTLDLHYSTVSRIIKVVEEKTSKYKT